MLGLKILLGIVLVLALLIILLCRTRIGVRAAYGAALKLDVTFGFLTLHILPAKEKPKKKKANIKKPKKKKSKKKQAQPPETSSGAEAEKKPKKSLPPVKLSDIPDAFHTLWPPLKRALARTRRGIRIEPLHLSLTLGGRFDPVSAAKQYGYLQALVWTGMPVLEELLDIPNPYIHTGVDFDAPSTAVEGEIGISIRIGTLLNVGLGVGIPALRWFLAFRKELKQRAKQKQAEVVQENPEEPAKSA